MPDNFTKVYNTVLCTRSETAMSQGPSSAPQEFSPNTLVRAYRIEERIGAGGMGVVYRATDTKLGRPVALKVIRSELLNEESLARFEREARVLASLNHPRIAAIHGMEESAGTQFLVLEYVPGPTLADRLRRGRLPIREAMLVGQQIAEAVEAAHAKDIIHRDLKPANIKLAENGQVKVLDFGLAKSIEQAQAVSADTTVTMRDSVTAGISIAGTAAYMSPEQACGKGLDFRTDIWSFGCVLYEMLSGKQAFRGSTLTEILAAVVEREPDWKALPVDTPESIQALLKRCLGKGPARRLRDIGDARIELEDAVSAPASATAKQSAITRRTAISGMAGAVAGAAATGIFAIGRWRGAVPRNVTRFAIAVPEGDSIPFSFASRVAISRDGARLAYVVAHQSQFNRLYIRSFRELEPRLVWENGPAPFFSSDGQWIGFFRMGRDGQVAKIGVGGGAPVPVSPGQTLMSGTWAEDDTIYAVLTAPGGLVSIPAAGGPPKEALKIDFAKGERQHKFPCALPEGNAVLLTMSTAETETFDDARIVAFLPRTGEKKVLAEGGTHPRYSPSGHLLYARDSKILAIGFDSRRLKTSGQPFTVLEGVQMSRNTGVANYDISAAGDLVYVPGICDGGARALVWVDRNGKAEAVASLPRRSYLHPRLAPDSRRLAIEIEGPSHDLYVYDFERGVLSNVTTDGVSHWPVWSPDGSQLAYRLGPMGAFKLRYVSVDRSRPPSEIPAWGSAQSAESWSPDGRALVYTASAPGVANRMMVAPLEGDRTTRPLDTVGVPEGSPKFSPDGRWLAYCSMESGKPQVYVQAYPGPGAKFQISDGGGTDPVWKRTGGELFYRNDDSMVAVSVSTAPSFKAGRPQELWKGHYSHGMSSSCGPPGATSSNYDVTADGKRFLMIKDDDQDRATSRQIVIVQGWADELLRMATQA